MRIVCKDGFLIYQHSFTEELDFDQFIVDEDLNCTLLLDGEQQCVLSDPQAIYKQ